MANGDELPVVGKDGSRWVGRAVRSGGVERIEVRLADGRRVMLPAEGTQRQADGTLYVPMGAAELSGDGGDRQDVVVPVVREELVVGNREEEGARVVVHVVPSERTEVVDVPVMREEVEVERRAVNRFVTEAGPVRQEGDVTIVPVYEDVIVVERRPVDRPATAADGAAFRERAVEATERQEKPVVAKEARVVEEIVVNKDVQQRTETVRDTVRRADVDVQRVNPGQGAAFAPDTFADEIVRDERFRGRDWSAVEPDVRRSFEQRYPGSRWEQFKDAVHRGYERARQKV